MPSFVIIAYLMTEKSVPRITHGLLAKGFGVKPYLENDELTNCSAVSCVLGILVSSENKTDSLSVNDEFSQLLQELEVPYYGYAVMESRAERRRVRARSRRHAGAHRARRCFTNFLLTPGFFPKQTLRSVSSNNGQVIPLHSKDDSILLDEDDGIIDDQ